MDNLKNIVVIKDLPSNLIDEAFLILKPNKKKESFEYAKKQIEKNKFGNSKDYVIKEAEILIDSFLNKNDIANKKEIDKLKSKNKRLKKINIILSCILISIFIFNVFV